MAFPAPRLNTFAAACLLVATAALAQTPARPTFEVVSVVPSVSLQAQIASGSIRVSSTITDTRIDLLSASLAELLTIAYRIKPYQLNGPDWMRSERYDVRATYPAGATKEQMPEMLQALLADRFKAVVRRDKKEHSVYALAVADEGLKLKPFEAQPAPPAPEPGGRTLEVGGQKLQMGADGRTASVAGPDGQTARISQGDGVIRMELGKVTMPALADMLSTLLDRPVVDVTNVAGAFQVPLELKQEDLLAMARNAAQAAGVTLPAGAVPGVTGGQASEPSGSSVFQAVQKLGLRLDARKMPVDVIVLESAEKKPTEN